MKYSERFQKYLSHEAVIRRHSPSYVAVQKSLYRNHIRPYEDKPVEDLQLHIASLSRTQANSVANLYKSLYGVELGRSKVVIKTIEILTPEEQKALLSQSLDPYDRLMLLLALDAGLRLSEILALKWGDLVKASRSLCVRSSDWKGSDLPTKGRNERTVPATGRLWGVLMAVRAFTERPTDAGTRIFNNFNKGKMERCIIKSYESAGLAHKAGCHILRHTFCTTLAERGVPVHVIQYLAGHASVTTTQRYLHYKESEGIRAIRALTTTAQTGQSLTI